MSVEGNGVAARDSPSLDGLDSCFVLVLCPDIKGEALVGRDNNVRHVRRHCTGGSVFTVIILQSEHLRGAVTGNGAPRIAGHELNDSLIHIGDIVALISGILIIVPDILIIVQVDDIVGAENSSLANQRRTVEFGIRLNINIVDVITVIVVILFHGRNQVNYLRTGSSGSVDHVDSKRIFALRVDIMLTHGVVYRIRGRRSPASIKRDIAVHKNTDKGRHFNLAVFILIPLRKGIVSTSRRRTNQSERRAFIYFDSRRSIGAFRSGHGVAVNRIFPCAAIGIEGQSDGSCGGRFNRYFGITNLCFGNSNFFIGPGGKIGQVDIFIGRNILTVNISFRFDLYGLFLNRFRNITNFPSQGLIIFAKSQACIATINDYKFIGVHNVSHDGIGASRNCLDLSSPLCKGITQLILIIRASNIDKMLILLIGSHTLQVVCS